jgi:sulfur transfer complex TusBCD TusB component (DsrH family)
LPIEYSEGIHGKKKYRLEFMHFTLEQDDRIILLSDGVTQAGMVQKVSAWLGQSGVTLLTEKLIATEACQAHGNYRKSSSAGRMR